MRVQRCGVFLKDPGYFHATNHAHDQLETVASGPLSDRQSEAR
jgi:hypothetical protein